MPDATREIPIVPYEEGDVELGPELEGRVTDPPLLDRTRDAWGRVKARLIDPKTDHEI
jgi:hypothetical protein